MENQVRASRRKYHIIYKTTCITTGRWYIGMHSTDNLLDGYIGSGQVLWKSIAKYGRENHVCQILEYLEDRESLSKREEELITREILNEELCMNLRSGGTGSYPGRSIKEETLKKQSASMKEAWASGKMTGFRGGKHTKESIAKQVANATGNKRTEEQKENITSGLLSHYSKEENIQIHKERMGKEEVKSKMRKSHQLRLESETPEQKAIRCAIMKEVANREGMKEKVTAAIRKMVKTRKKPSDEVRARQNLLSSQLNSKPCTVDGITIYSSQTELVKALGQGKKGRRSPNFRYV